MYTNTDIEDIEVNVTWVPTDQYTTRDSHKIRVGRCFKSPELTLEFKLNEYLENQKST